MRKLFVILLAVMSLTAQAQDEKKNYVGGSIGVWHEKTHEGSTLMKTTSIQFLPELGRWVNERWAVGTTIGIVQYNAKQPASIFTKEKIVKARAFALNPYIRYEYFQKSIVGLFVDAECGIGIAKEKGAKNSITNYEIGLRPGVSLHVSDRVHLHGHFGFIGVKGDSEDGFNAGGLNLEANEFNLGVVWNF